MKKLNSLLDKKLTQYSLLVAPALAAAGTANAQVAYHDIYPDITYIDSIAGDNYTDPVLLDLDNDGVYDAQFAVWSSAESKNGPNMVNLAAVRQFGANGNAIMGYTNIFSASICSTPLPLYCASVLNENAEIGPAANFWAVPGSNTLGTLVRYFKDQPAPGNVLGQWNNKIDRYIGLRFYGGDGNLHYGWIRLDVTKSPASIVLKEYAYELAPNVAIAAGEKDLVGIQDINAATECHVNIQEGNLHVWIDNNNDKQATLSVTNLLGQEVIQQAMVNNITVLDLHPFSKGIYIVSIRHGDAHFSQQVFYGQ